MNDDRLEIDWLAAILAAGSIERETERIRASIGCYRSSLERQLARQSVNLTSITLLRFHRPAGQRKFMIATDDRGRTYKIHVDELK